MIKTIPISLKKKKSTVNRIFEEEVNSLKKELNKGNNVFDYFLILGIDPSICTEEFLYSSTLEELNVNYADIIKPKIISKFPPFDKSFIIVDNGIIDHCFPKGFKVKQFSFHPSPEYFSLILDNYLFSLSNPQKYVSCLTFYESISSYEELKILIQAKDNKNKNTRSKSCKNTKKIIEYQIREPYGKRSCSNIKKTNIKYYNYYIPKCICLISVNPFYDSHYQILTSIYRNSFNLNMKIPIEKVIQNLIIETPLPPKGMYKVGIKIFDEDFAVYQRKVNDLPNVEREMGIIISTLGIDNTIEVFLHMLFETKIIVFSLDEKILRPVIYGFLSMIFPFKYPYQVVSFIPKKNYHIIESISPYLIGINEEYQEDFFKKQRIDISETSIFIVDLNRKTVELKTKETFPPLPNALKKKLSTSLNNALKKRHKKFILKKASSLNNNKEQKVSYPLIDEKLSLHLPFFYFIISIMQTYPNYLNQEYYISHDRQQINNIKTLFKVNEFLSSISASERSFYYKFLQETQIFSDVIFKRMLPKDINDKLDILFFDEHIILKCGNKKAFGRQEPIFITSNEYDHKTTVQATKILPFSVNEIKQFNQPSYIQSQLNNAQIIKISRGKIFFSYPLFPSLNSDILYNQLNTITPLRNLGVDLDSINIELVSKSHLESLSLDQSEMENYIYLSWLQLWAATFWYQDLDERNYIFNLLIKVLNKVTHHEMEIINQLFEALAKFNEEEKMVKLYQKLLCLKQNPSQYIYSTVSKILSRKKLKLSVDNQDDTMFYEECDEGKIFRKRTLKDKREANILGEVVRFGAYDECLQCKGQINLAKISMDYERMRKEPLWAMCPLCNKPTFVKLPIKMGKEFNKTKCLKTHTSTNDKIVLFSPYLLKVALGDAILQEMGKFVDTSNFKSRFTALFWNSIWYFQLNQLDYRMILPYAENLNKGKMSLYPLQRVSSFSRLKNNEEHLCIEKKERPKRWEDICKLQFESKVVNETFVIKSMIDFPSEQFSGEVFGHKREESYINPSLLRDDSLGRRSGDLQLGDNDNCKSSEVVGAMKSKFYKQSDEGNSEKEMENREEKEVNLPIIEEDAKEINAIEKKL